MVYSTRRWELSRCRANASGASNIAIGDSAFADKQAARLTRSSATLQEPTSPTVSDNIYIGATAGCWRSHQRERDHPHRRPRVHQRLLYWRHLGCSESPVTRLW